MSKKIIIQFLMLIFVINVCSAQQSNVKSSHSLVFDHLASTWDEAIPLGNGMLGALIWQKEGNLRFSLDKADLWDMRPMDIKNRDEWKYSWIIEQHKNGTFNRVKNKLDRLYDDNPAPTKIPGAALEFDIKQFGEVESVVLTVSDALCEVKWKNNVQMKTFVNATNNAGWFHFKGVDENFQPTIIPPNYNTGDSKRKGNSLTGQDLITLGYPKGEIKQNKNSQSYIQEGWGGFKYHVYVEWNFDNNVLTGSWSISTEYPKWAKTKDAEEIVKNSLKSSFDKQLEEHKGWWKDFWNRSSINIPDKRIEKQWYLDMYKFGSAARSDSPPIALQAIWTADSGTIPPWKGDFHHDLNVQLSYWPAYSGNHLDLEEGLLNWLWQYKDNFSDFTREFFETDGINIPGATSIEGMSMGGWSQYAYTPTASAWIAHHFYLHWRYSMDREFLKERAYPWIKEVALFLDGISEKGKDGKLKLPLSSSPEIYNNEARAWFKDVTNYDLALIRWTYEKAAELATELGQIKEAEKWQNILSKWPDYAVDPDTGLMYAPDFPCDESHRHLSQIMAIHPLGLIDWSQGKESQEIITNSVQNLKNLGTEWWTGYSFSWFANVQARMHDGNGAAETLRIFAENFCLPNSFHVNGEQYDRGYSNFKYRPFTLEGNFAFAAAVLEMLIQSHTGIVHIFPAIPDNWEKASFSNLRTEGAFLVSAKRENNKVYFIKIESEKGGEIKIKNPFDKGIYYSASVKVEGGEIITMQMQPGEIIKLTKQIEN